MNSQALRESSPQEPIDWTRLLEAVMVDQEADSASTPGSLAMQLVRLSDADWQLPDNPHYPVNSADIHKLVLAFGNGPEIEHHWAWQAWKSGELARGKSHDQFELLIDQLYAVSLPTTDALTDEGFTHWKHNVFDLAFQRDVTEDDVMTNKLCIQMLLAINQEFLRTYTIGSGDVPARYVPAWAISPSIGRIHRHSDKLLNVTTFPRLTILGDADTLCWSHVFGCQLGKPRSRLRKELRNMIQRRVTSLVRHANVYRRDLIGHTFHARDDA